MKSKILGLLAVGLLAGPAIANSAQILVNGGFETGTLAGWSSVGLPTVTTTEAHTGTYSVAAIGDGAISQSFAAVATNLITEVSFWVKRNDFIFNEYTFFYSDGTFGTFSVFQFVTGDDWTFVDVTSNLGSGKNLSGFRIFGTTPGPAYLDDFTIAANAAAVPEPGTLALLGLGLLGLGVSRRRKTAGSP